MRRKFVAASLIICCTLMSYTPKAPGSSTSDEPTIAELREISSASVSIPYKIANRYFVKNSFKKEDHPSPKFTSEAEFHSAFGSAPIMGKNGKPTSIDFAHEYAIAVIGELTDRNTTIKVISLKKTRNEIVLNYKITEGEKLSVTLQPLLLLSVENKYKGEVKLVRR